MNEALDCELKDLIVRVPNNIPKPSSDYNGVIKYILFLKTGLRPKAAHRFCSQVSEDYPLRKYKVIIQLHPLKSLSIH